MSEPTPEQPAPAVQEPPPAPLDAGRVSEWSMKLGFSSLALAVLFLISAWVTRGGALTWLDWTGIVAGLLSLPAGLGALALGAMGMQRAAQGSGKGSWASMGIAAWVASVVPLALGFMHWQKVKEREAERPVLAELAEVARVMKRMKSRAKATDVTGRSIWWGQYVPRMEVEEGSAQAVMRVEKFSPHRADRTVGAGEAAVEGYWFRMMDRGPGGAPYEGRAKTASEASVEGYGICAYPAEYRAGMRTFVMDERGVVFAKDLGPGKAAGLDEWPEGDLRDRGWAVVAWATDATLEEWRMHHGEETPLTPFVE